MARQNNGMAPFIKTTSPNASKKRLARGCALALGAVVKKSSEYRHYAEECRALANKMPPGEQRDAILTIAAIWEKLALVRANRAQAAATCSPVERSAAVDQIVGTVLP